jgi:hypothetical protein
MVEPKLEARMRVMTGLDGRVRSAQSRSADCPGRRDRSPLPEMNGFVK